MNQRSWRANKNHFEKSSPLDPKLTWSTSEFGKSAVFEPRLVWVANEKHDREDYPKGKDFYDYYTLIGGGDGIVNVFKAVCRPLNSCLVAVKIIDILRSKTFFDYVHARAMIMPHLDHPNIVRTHCVFTATQCLWVVTPYIPGGSFQSIVAASYQDGLPEHYIAAILGQVLKALVYLHGEGYSHGNIKPGNVLIDIDGTVLLADFLSEAINHDCDPANNDDGTPGYWIAPELKYRALSPKADMWSFGITALELIYGSRVPVSQRPTSKSSLEKISRRYRYTEHYEKRKDGIRALYMSQSFKDMVGWCLREDPSTRPTAEDLLMHPFFRNCHVPEYLVENLLDFLPHDVETRFTHAEADRRRKIAKKREANSPVGEDVVQKKIIEWKLNREEIEMEPVFEGESIISGENIDKNVGTNGTVSSGKDTDGIVTLPRKKYENVGTNGFIPSEKDIDESVVVNDTVPLGKNIDDDSVVVNDTVLLRKNIDDDSVVVNDTVPLGTKNEENVEMNGIASPRKDIDVNVVEYFASLEKSFDGQKEILRGVKELMASYVGQESAWKKREAELMKNVEELRSEIENEKKIISGLGLELKFLKSTKPEA